MDTANAQLELTGAIGGSVESEQEDVHITRQGFEDRDAHGTSSTHDGYWRFFHHGKRPRKNVGIKKM